MAGKYRKKTQTEDKIKITLYATPELHRQITEKADKDKHSISSVCENIIEKHFGITFENESVEGGEDEQAENE